VKTRRFNDITGAPVNDELRKQNLPGMGGVFNIVNLHTYHYAGNNPVKYLDPDGRIGQGQKNGGITSGQALRMIMALSEIYYTGEKEVSEKHLELYDPNSTYRGGGIISLIDIEEKLAMGDFTFQQKIERDLTGNILPGYIVKSKYDNEYVWLKTIFEW
jgi:hypothetical protein